MTKRLISQLTQAQIYVLSRLASGTKYEICGDFRRARECRTFKGASDDVRCRSTPVLFRLGLVELARPTLKPLSGSYYQVKLSSTGRDILDSFERD
ncbi:hypothetical protein JND74_002437 [Salmonella enterica]|nr:hypothetical protein [Salmonella enterica]EHE3167751.1 hypothetical protein [Salmonella enterica]EHM5264119.1 hypothetical protein [Salmonella enterica]EIR0277831.1 hypothetical protein [Salmonella enterica]